jgi:iron complex outermembrane recepter protein
MNNRNNMKFVLAASTLLSPFLAAPAMAQVQDIIVTAQKRDEKLQEVPIAITALSSAQLETKGVANAADLSGLAPNLTTANGTSGASDLTISMRGLPAADALMGNDGPVGIYIDGVINSRISGAVIDLVDLERVEVLRGPQGTLYGRNTTGGAVNFITKKPGKEFGVTQKFGVQTYGGITSRTSVDTGEWGDSGITANLSFLYKKIGGYYDNLAKPDKDDPGSENVRAGRIALNYDRGGAFRANYAYTHSASENGNLIGQVTAYSPAYLSSPFGLPLATGNRRDEITLANSGTDDVINNIHNLTLEYDLTDNIVVKSITGYKRYQDTTEGPQFGEATTFLAGNFAPIPVAPFVTFVPTGFVTKSPFSASNERTHEQWSQELQLNGSAGEAVPGGPRLTYATGGYMFREQGSEDNPQSFIFPIGGGAGLNLFNPLAYNTSAKSWAVYGQASYSPQILGDNLRLTAGLRYSEDKKEQNLLTSAGLAAPVSREAKFNATTWLLKAQYFLNEDINAYVSYSRGYKAGGFNTRSLALEPFKPETLKSLEVGVKANWLDRRLQTNVSAFFNKANDQQVAEFRAGAGGASNVVTNAGSSEYTGVEFEIIAKPVDGITLDWSMGFVNPEYKEYGTSYLTNPALPFNAVTNPLIPFDAADIARFGYTSQTTGNAGIQYDSKPIPAFRDGKIQARVEAVWQSKQDFHPAIVYPNGVRDNPLIDSTTADARTLVNARLALNEVGAGALGTVSFALWGKNLLDEEYIIQGIDFGALGIAENTFGAPLTAGFDVTFRY